jgi:hypothetical protein
MSTVRVRYVENDRAMLDVAKMGVVLDGTKAIAEKIADDVSRSTSGSRTLRPYGKRMVVDETETGALVGTDWGPAVPVEFGTIDTPPNRILLGAAERNAKRIELS